MYNPRHFQADDRGLLVELMRTHSFANLVTTDDQGAIVAGSYPFLIRVPAEPTAPLVLRAHVARGNPQWRQLARAGARPLVVFNGPHAYVSPAHYEPGAHVPTWNYATVHAEGRGRILEDAAEFEALMRELVSHHESTRAAPWPLALERDELEELMGRIVGFEIEVTRLEGKLKLSQNQTPANRAGVLAAFSTSADPGERAVGALMSRMMRQVAGRST